MQDFTDDLRALRERLAQAEHFLRVTDLRARRPQLEAEMSRPDLWDHPEEARRVQTEMSAVLDDLAVCDRLAQRIEDAETLFELGREEADDSVEAEVREAIAQVAAQFEQLEMRALFTGEYDAGDAVCTIKAGAGGTDAQDWAEMLLRMYRRWAERNGYGFELDAVNEGQEAGITTAEFIVRGRNTYGMLRAEHGVHRLVRISPFNNEGKRQTAFASLYVAPFFEAMANEVEIDEKELRVDVFRRPARKHHRFRRAHHAPSVGHRRVVSKRAQPDPEPRPGHAGARSEAARPRAPKARRRDLGHRR